MTLTRDDNPYLPGFGVVPPALAGREPEFADLEAALRRVRNGTYEQPRLLSGDRGMGKTAVLVELVRSSREDGVWAVEIEAGTSTDALVPLLRGLRDLLVDHDLDARVGGYARRALEVLSAFGARHRGFQISLDVAPSSTAGGSGDLGTDLADVLEATTGVAARAGSAVLLTIDEIQAMPPKQMGPIFAALQRVARHETEPGRHLPLLTVVAGLPRSRAAMRRASSTYAERVREHTLGLLDDAAVIEAVTVPARERGVRFDSGALAALVGAIGGYPYFAQLHAYEAWNAAADAGGEDVVDAAAARAGVERGRREAARLYESRLEEVPDTERRYLEAVARLDGDERRSGTIAAQLGGTAEEWGWARQRLIGRGLLRPAGYGKVTFALPGLDEHLRSRP